MEYKEWVGWRLPPDLRRVAVSMAKSKETSKHQNQPARARVVGLLKTSTAAALANSFAFLDYISTFDVSFYDAS